MSPSPSASARRIASRFVASSLAYQGFGRELPVDEVAYVNDWGTGGLRPDLTVLIEVPEDVAAEHTLTRAAHWRLCKRSA